MSFLEEFGKQAAQDGWGILTSWGRQELLDTPTITSPATPAAPATPAGTFTPTTVADPRNDLETGNNISIFGLPVNKTAAAVVGFALAAVVVLKAVRG